MINIPRVFLYSLAAILNRVIPVYSLCQWDLRVHRYVSNISKGLGFQILRRHLKRPVNLRKAGETWESLGDSGASVSVRDLPPVDSSAKHSGRPWDDCQRFTNVLYTNCVKTG